MEEEGSPAATLLLVFSGAQRPVDYLPAPPLAFLVEVLGFLPPPLLPGPLSPIVKPLLYGAKRAFRA